MTLARRLLLGVLLGALTLVAISVYGDLRQLSHHLTRFPWWLLLPVLGLTLGNYLLRFIKWHYLLRRTGAEVDTPHSALIFLSGLSMAISPGKIGELLKSYLLKLSRGLPMPQTAPVVIAERVTDLLAILLLCLTGLASGLSSPAFLTLLILCAAAVLILTALLASDRLMTRLLRLLGRVPGLRRVTPRLTGFTTHMAAQLRPAPLVVTTLLSVLAWLCEALGFYLILNGLPGVQAPLLLAVFIYAATTLLGALSFLPGGLGVTEGSMVLLLMRTASGLSRSLAVAATLLIRLCTLWFAVLCGLIALGLFRQRLGRALELDGALEPGPPQPDPSDRG